MPSPPENRIIEKNLTKDTTVHTKTLEELKNRLENKELVDSSITGPLEEAMIPETQPGMTTKHFNYPPPPPLLNEEGLIVPRKPMNPCLESTDRQNLHRELLFNQKIGKNVLNQKSELQRALEKHKDNQAKKELENQLTQSTPEFEKVIADRAKRLQDIPVQKWLAVVVRATRGRKLSRENSYDRRTVDVADAIYLEHGDLDKTSNEDDKGLNKEFLQARAKLRARNDSK